MNERAVGVLVDAALNGHEQLKNTWRSSNGGAHCARGLLHDALPGHGERCCYSDCIVAALKEHFDMDEDEQWNVMEKNDRGMDFLTIARKFGTKDEA